MNEVERVENGAVHEGLGEGARSGFTQAAWEEIRRAYGWPRTCFPLALFAAASWGTWDSFSDGAGDRLYGTFTLLAPVLLVRSEERRVGKESQSRSERPKKN